ncbi:MAG TPA: hypothetical protein VMT35_04310, partial [Ignavibacteriaceae bacterium]|nr:hypothetical protein [Ignavibacteriaceae bacterium]
MKNTILIIIASIIPLLFTGVKINGPLPYKDRSLTIDERVEDLLGRMTLQEKIGMLGGTGFETKEIKRLGIPPMNMTDGPVGVRWNVPSG